MSVLMRLSELQVTLAAAVKLPERSIVNNTPVEKSQLALNTKF
jgi:hypothetical protein